MLLLYFFHHFCECIRFCAREFGKHFAVELNVFFFQRLDKAGVGEARLAGGGIDAHIPKAAHIAFFIFSPFVHMPPGMSYGFFGESIDIFAAPFEAFGVREKLFSFFGADIAAFDSNHMCKLR